MTSFRTTAKQFAIQAYRRATWPVRVQAARAAVRNGTVPVHSLFYHRVCDHTMNDWTISLSGFERQVNWMQRNFDMVSLAEAQRRIRSGHNTRSTLALTFDDGYADNSLNILPMLIKRKIPFTYFVCTDHMITGEPFQHDVALNRPLPPHDVESVRALAASPHVEVGGHTRTHADLGKVTDPQQLFDEVITASQELGDLIGQPVRYFAFPFGLHQNLNVEAFRLLQQHGFAGVCSAYGGRNEIGGDAFHIQRLHGDPMFARIQNWLTYDPRLQKVNRFEYQSNEPNPTIVSVSDTAETVAEDDSQSKPITFPSLDITTDINSMDFSAMDFSAMDRDLHR